MPDFRVFKVLTFDCYGTLIDWEKGILTALRPLLSCHNIYVPNVRILELYGRLERQYQQERPFVNYRNVLRRVVQGFAKQLGFCPSPSELETLGKSLRKWKPFPDVVPALKTLEQHYRLAIISNIDRDLFDHSARYVEVPFEWVITSEEVRHYKPSKENFQHALRTLEVPPGQVLHVAQSLYHDIAPARQLGMTTVWVNRKSARSIPAIAVQPDLEVPDLKALVSLIESRA